MGARVAAGARVGFAILIAGEGVRCIPGAGADKVAFWS
jgi:hypothetical protein